MERWEIRASPSADDSQRHLLLIRGSMVEVVAILKKFGALCGRPAPLDEGDFNLSLVLHRVTPEVRKKLNDYLGKMAPAPAAPMPDIPIPTEVRMATPLRVPAALPNAAPAAASPTPLSETLRPGWTFESLLVGAYNRFAHAAAMSVVSSPGSMYNPLFLYGVPGTGKSHLLHAVATAMSKGLGDASLLVTSGARLARAVSVCAASGSMAEIDKKVADSKAIFVDDVHLMAVTDRNKDLLAMLFKSFFDRRQQVVITSLYPPRALGTLEEALKFSFSKGWSVDLKIPNSAVQKDLVASVCERLAAQLTGDEIGSLHEKLSQWGYQDLALWVHRFAVLRRMREAAGRSATLMEMLMLIYQPIVGGGAAASAAPNTASFTPPAAAAGAEPLAVITPRGQEGLGTLAATMFYEVGAKNGFAQTYRHTLWETYDAMQQVGVPFEIADMCHRAGVTRALIVGPGPDSPLAARADGFSHAVRRILDSAGAQTGWIPFPGLQTGAHYLNAHLDFDKTWNNWPPSIV